MRRLVPFFNFSLLLFVLSVLFLFKPFFFDNKLPIPSDTIVGLYYPFRDLYVKDYPRGIPYKNFLITDPVRQQYPWRQLAIDEEKRFQLPLWNPYTMAGMPLLGSLQSAAFYPLNILLFILPFSIGWSVLILLQPILAGIFSYFYLRNLGLYRISSILGGLVFAFCGFSVAWLEWGTVEHVGVWLPLILLAIDKLFFHLHALNAKRKTFLYVWSAILVFSLCASFFAGHLQTFFYLLITAVAYCLVRWIQGGRAVRYFVWFFVLFLLFAVITCVQWLPLFQLINLSARDIDQLNWQNIQGWFIPWQHLIQFVVPDFFGNPTTLNYWGTWNYGELIGYVGIIPLIMALYALFFRRDRAVFFFGTIFFLSLIFALPTYFAQLPYIYHIPFLSTAQPTRLLFLTDFSLSILAAFGMDWYIRHDKKLHIIYPVLFIGAIFIGLWLFVMHGSGETILVAKRNLYFPTLLFALTFVVVVINILVKQKRIFFLLIGILLLMSLVDLFRFAQKFTPFTSSDYLFPHTAILSFLQHDTSQFRIMATDPRIMPPNFSVAYHLQSVDGYDPLYLRRYGELIAASERGRPDIHPPFGFNRIITPENSNSRIIDLLGVKYILSFSDLPNKQFTRVEGEGLTNLYQNNNAFPRAFFTANVRPVNSKQEAIGALLDNLVDLHKTAIVENWDGDSNLFTQGNVVITQYSDNRIIMHSENNGQGFLVLTDSYYPTWSATVCTENGSNCQEKKMYLTDYNFRGIVVPAGNHRIEFYNSLL